MGKPRFLSPEADKEWRARRNAQGKAYYAANKEKFIARRKEYVRLNPEKTKAACDKYRSKNLDILNARNREAHRARKIANPEMKKGYDGRFIRKVGAFLDTFKKKLISGRCNYIGCTVPWQTCDIGHIFPDRKGKQLSMCKGVEAILAEIRRNTDPDGTVNLQLLCPNHHRMKTYKHEDNTKTKGGGALQKRVFFIEWRKLQGECNLCKIGFEALPLYCWDADHIDQSLKTCSVGNIVVGSYTMEQLQAELKKCRLLCATCHRVHAAKQLGWRWADALTLCPMPQ